MRLNAESSIPSIPRIPDRWADGMDDFKFNCELGFNRRSGRAEKERVFSGAMRTGKKFTRKRNHFTKPRCLEPCTGFTDARGAARNSAKSRGFGKSIPLTYEEGIGRRVSSGFEENRILRQTAKQVFGNANPLRCFHHENLGGFYEHQK